MNIKSVFKRIVFINMILIPSLVFAGGTNFNSITSSKALSLGGLYLAGVDGVSSVFSNPSKLSSLTSNSAEFYFLDKVHEYNYKTMGGKSYKSFDNDSFIFSFGGIYNLSSELNIGIGYNNIFDYNLSWPYLILIKSPTNSSVQTYNISQEFSLNAATFSASYKMNNFSLGISANVVILNTTSEFYQTNPLWKNDIGLAGYQFKYEQDAIGFGVNLAMNYQINEKTNLSFLVKQGVSFSLDGDAETNMLLDLDSAKSKVGVNSEFEIPWAFGIGFLYGINDNWKINCDLMYSLWGSTEQNINYEFDDSKWKNYNFQTDSISGYNPREQTLEFENALELGLGLEYFNPSGVNVRFGYKYSGTQNSSKSYSFLLPNTNEHWITAGIGFKYEQFTIDAAIAVIIGSENEVESINNAFFAGSYNSRGYYPSFTINYKF